MTTIPATQPRDTGFIWLLATAGLVWLIAVVWASLSPNFDASET